MPMAPSAMPHRAAQFAADGHECRSRIGPTTLLRVASISKLATTLAVMRLVQRGELDLDRDISAYLGYSLRNPAFPDRAITLRQLLAHSSSLVDGEVYWAPHPRTLRELLAMPGHFDTARAPGSCFRYTNLNFGVIGSVLERTSGLRFDALMQREVFGPAGIEAGFNWSNLAQVDPARVGTIWQRGNDGAGPWQAQLDDFGGNAPRVEVRTRAAGGAEVLAAAPTDYEPGRNGTLFSPQGGMRISVAGLLALGAQLLPAGLGDRGVPRLIDERSRRTMLAAAEPPALLADCDRQQQPPTRRYGLGIELLRFPKQAGQGAGDDFWVGHFGDAYGLKAAVLANPVTGTVRAYIINGSGRPLPAAAAPYVEMDLAEASLLGHWPWL